MKTVRVYHSFYSCDTGCCGHTVEMPEMAARLRSLEWVGYEGEMGFHTPRCPECEAYEHDGHVPGCEFAALLARLDGPLAAPETAQRKDRE